MDRGPEWGERSRIVALSVADVRAALRLARLDDDPFDPRIGLVLASHAFWEWTVDEEDRLADESAEPSVSLDPGKGLSIWEGASEAFQRRCPVMDLVCGDHRIALLAVVRREGSQAAAEYRWALNLPTVMTVEPEAVCCAYVQVAAAGEVTVLLDGFVDAEQLAKADRVESDAGPCIIISEADLQPMGELYALLSEPAVVKLYSASAARLRPRHWKAVPRAGVRRRWVAAASIAAALVGAVVMWGLMEPHIQKPQLGGSVAEWDLNMEAFRGSEDSTRVVYSGQKYSVTIRVATPRACGWLYQVDKAGAYLLGALEPQAQGILGLTYAGEFDDRPGVEYFVVVLSDEKVPALTGNGKPAEWLSPSAASTLQELGRQQKDAEAETELRGALDQAGLDGKAYDVRLMRIMHLPRQSGV